jgi:hypothetical protein
MKKSYAIAAVLFLLISTSCSNINDFLPKPEVPPTDVPAIPIANAAQRITKKDFGTYVEPGNSPVDPEVFRGFHTAIDLETFDNEQNIDVDIFAICTGPLLLSRWAQGYGGVIVQGCTIDNKDVTVIYGHIDLESVAANLGDTLVKGEKIAILGDPYSNETDNERKHLHLGIHKGKEIQLLGYIQDKAQLVNWIDPKTVL